MQSADYNLLDCSIMGIADYIRNTRLMVPRWMNTSEVSAYKVGFNRARSQCEGTSVQTRNSKM